MIRPYAFLYTFSEIIELIKFVQIVNGLLYILVLGICPKGDDPLSVFTDYRSIKIKAKATRGIMAGFFKFSFNGQSISFPADSRTWTTQECQNTFQMLPNVQTVQCSFAAPTDHHGTTEYLIQFRAFPVLPFENNIYVNDGNPPNSAFVCDTASVVGSDTVTCTITDVAVNLLPGKMLFFGFLLLVGTDPLRVLSL